VQSFLTYAIDAYDVDVDRIYLTGLSCGAFGGWDYLGAYGDTQVAAAVLIAGNGANAWFAAGCNLGRVPIWAFHGDADNIVDVTGTTFPVEELLGCAPAPDVQMTIYPGVGHNSWARTYDLSAGHDIYAWLLEH
jgi:predicted peptidase